MALFSVAAIFSNHMVLQRNKNVRVFGHGESGEVVTVHYRDVTVQTIVEKEQWTAILPPMEACEPSELFVQCGENKCTYSDVVVGEVWLAGGQSNMEFELRNCIGGKECLKNDSNCNVRFYYTQKNAYMDESFFESEKKTSWQVFGEEQAQAWSAVGYFFAKRLAKELGVTVGIIGCNWGGTSASAWVSKLVLEQDQELNTYLLDYAESIEGKSIEDQIKEYDEYVAYHTEWEKRFAREYEKNPELRWEDALDVCGENRWPGPMNCKNPLRPVGLYECMLQRVMPYTLRGFIYYQGESDDHKPQMYYKLMTKLIEQWRSDWEDDLLPFLMVQLPMHRYMNDPDFKNWPLIREAQMKVYKTIKNTGLAVILDCGEFNEIHPKDKLPVGERLALQAMYHVYDCIDEEKVFGPTYRSMIRKGNEIELSFDHVFEGFDVQGDIEGFEIAGQDKIYVPANVKIEDSHIIVWSKQISEPMYVRYCWVNYSKVSVFGKNGIPLAPFRTSMHDTIDLQKESIDNIQKKGEVSL